MMEDQTEDFVTVKYRADREHELKLNEFTHNLEMEQLRLLILFNGGAATAVLAFAEKAKLGSALETLMWAVAPWLLGLCVGAWGIIRMRSVQSKFAGAYFHRRRAVECRRGVGPPDADEKGEEAAANAALEKARDGNDEIPWYLGGGLALFVLGAAIAALAIASVPPEKMPASSPAAHDSTR
jgi:hypothetical protein